MSRLLWVGVGAAGGIYAYRRGNRAWDEAKERGVAGNAAVLASSASTMLNHAKRALAEAQEAKDTEMAEDRSIGFPSRGPARKPTYVQQRELLADPQVDPAQDSVRGVRQDEVYGPGSTHDARRRSRTSRAAASLGNPVKFIIPRNRSSA